MRREELKGTGSTNKGYISGTSSKNYDQLKIQIYKDDHIRQESIANQETLQEEEEAKEQGICHDGLFNDEDDEEDDLFENIMIMTNKELEELEEYEFDDDDTKDREENEHTECMGDLFTSSHPNSNLSFNAKPYQPNICHCFFMSKR